MVGLKQKIKYGATGFEQKVKFGAKNLKIFFKNGVRIVGHSCKKGWYKVRKIAA